jgi:hypothetical protein
MKTNAGAKRRRRLAATAALVAALIVSLAVAVGPAAAEGGDSAEIVNRSEGGLDWFPDIRGPEAPEEYPVRLDNLSPELGVRQVSDQEVVVEYVKSSVTAFSINAVPASAADGATVPTTLALTEDEDGPIVTLVVHYRAGNPAAGGAPFVFPIITGEGWEGGFRTTSVGLSEPKPPSATPPAQSSPPPPSCTVPSLHGFGLRAAKARLRGADCGFGKVRLAPGATKGKGKVVKQFRTAGAQLPAGAPVAIKLG